jgi:hypothetical protein
MVWAKAGPHHNPTTDANSQNFFTVILPVTRFEFSHALWHCHRSA